MNYPEYAIDMLTGDIYKSIGYFGMDKKAPLGNIATIKDSFW